MQTCSVCYTQSPDTALVCRSCQADLKEYSLTAVTLKRLKANPRVNAIRISIAGDACPACAQIQGLYTKDQVPPLPHEGCSHGLGCRCFYDPVLNTIFP